MKPLKTLAAMIFAISAPSARAVELKTVDAKGQGGKQAVAIWGTVCVTNRDVLGGVKAQYKWGADGEWEDIVFKHNSQYAFRQRFGNDAEAAPLTVKFKISNADDAQEVAYVLDKSLTRFQQRHCRNVENYRFESQRDELETRDLVKAF